MNDANPKFVRSGRPGDAVFMARLQVLAMQDQLALAMPDVEFGGALSVDSIEAVWQQALGRPATTGQGVVIAEDDRVPVGFAAFADASAIDDSVITVKHGDLDQVEELADGSEILALEVEAHRGGQGHRSRLLSAVADLARAAGKRNLQVWLLAEDSDRIVFYKEAGFAPIGVRRTLDAGPELFSQHLWYAAFQ